MASVFYLIDDGLNIDEDIVQKYLEQGILERKRYFACVTVQKVWRGYWTRKIIKGWNCYATIIQKHVRGYLTRLHLDEIYRKIYDYKCNKHYNDMAARIQAAYKGYLTRKQFNVKKIREQRKKIEAANSEMMNFIKEQHKMFEEQKPQRESEDSFKKIANILFERHHLLRTEQKEGILSLNGKKELSYLEKLLKLIPWKNYMKEMRKIYNQNYSLVKGNEKLLNTDPIISRIYEVKDMHKKRFNLYTQNIKYPPHERMLNSSETYDLKKAVVCTRIEDKTKNISTTDFNLYSLRKVAKSNEIPPYYIDFWFEDCSEMKMYNI